MRRIKLLLGVAAVGAMLVIPMGTAGAHTHDGSVNNGDEGSFLRFKANSISLVTYADDLQTDGHCVYVRVQSGGVTYSRAYSCGAGDWGDYSYLGFSTTHQCITGHWDCDFPESFPGA